MTIPPSPADVRKAAGDTLEAIARGLGITVDELLEWASSLGKAGAILMAVAGIVAVLALAAYGGAITGVAAGIVIGVTMAFSVIGAITNSIALGIQWSAGKISTAQLMFGLTTNWAGVVVPGFGTKAVANAMGQAITAGQALRASAWGLLRGWNMASWTLSWR